MFEVLVRGITNPITQKEGGDAPTPTETKITAGFYGTAGLALGVVLAPKIKGLFKKKDPKELNA